MKLSNLTAISPVDGRYGNKTFDLAEYFSEYGLIKYRIKVELEYFIALSELDLKGLGRLSSEKYAQIREIHGRFDVKSAERVKEIENVTNHDVKAVEYYIKEEFDKIGLEKQKEFIHFGLTSQDINNTAIPLSFKDAVQYIMIPSLEDLIIKLKNRVEEWKDIAMLARTHGQPASPTRLGKEMMVFVERIEKQYHNLIQLPYPAKFGGATGNFNAHVVAYPEMNWIDFADNFVQEKLGLERSATTTQIDHYDGLASIFDNLSRINTILIDFTRDIWTYISFDYFKQKIIKGEVGSSTMPHKVNPIDFENAEGNLGVANAVYRHLSEKLPVSRLQRDLTDSTVLRNIGVPVAHSLIAVKSIVKGLNKLIVNQEKLNSDLEANWAVVGEGIQTILRREGFPNPYEKLKELTRTNQKINGDSIKDFIEKLDIGEDVKKELRKITPKNYTGK
ncbi:MAG: adenylosuccinate lyase [Bacteroidota bacterium]